jgi:hypothetical protein
LRRYRFELLTGAEVAGRATGAQSAPLTPNPLIGIKSEVGVKSEELVVVAAFLSFLVLFSFFVKAVNSVEKVMS